MTSPKDVLIALLAILVLVLGGTTWYYKGQFDSEHDKLVGLEATTKRQNDEATAKLQTLTDERDALQFALDTAAAEQEKKDAKAKADIDRLAREFEQRPFRVRIVPGPAGSCSGAAQGEGAAPAGAGAGNPGPAYGLLPEENSRRLAGALKEVETLSAAYNSCRARLIPATSKGE